MAPPIGGPARVSDLKGSTFLARCCVLYCRRQGDADRLCIPAGGELRAQVLHKSLDGSLGGNFGRAEMASLRRLALWMGQDGSFAEYVGSSQRCQHNKAEHAAFVAIAARREVMLALLIKNLNNGGDTTLWETSESQRSSVASEHLLGRYGRV